jgi:hypothetical protein
MRLSGRIEAINPHSNYGTSFVLMISPYRTCGAGIRIRKIRVLAPFQEVCSL